MKVLAILATLTATAALADNNQVITDGMANYYIVSSQQISSNGNLLVVSRREGISGTSFAAREVNCKTSSFRYISEGDSLDSIKSNARFDEPMAPVTFGSASYHVVMAACNG